MSRQVNVLRWVGLTGSLLALAAILLVGYMSKGSTQEEPTAEKKADESKLIVEKSGTVGTMQDPDGDTEYTLAAEDGVFNLGVGPRGSTRETTRWHRSWARR